MAKTENPKKSAPNKKGMKIILPGYANDKSGTEIYQSNRVTSARFKSITNIQQKLLVSIIAALQKPIRENMDGKDHTQLLLFKENKDTILIPIQLSDIAQPSQYPQVVEQAQALMNLQVSMKSPMGDDYISIASIVNRIEKPKKVDGKSMLYLRMDKDVAEKFILVDKNGAGKPINYTKFLLEVALKSKSKYTSKMYALISSWKVKGGFRITLDELRQVLGVEPGEYLEYSQFKRRVLVPVQQELESIADCWYNCSAKDFAVRTGKTVKLLNIKVIVPAMQEGLKQKAEMIKALLKTHFFFTDDHIKVLDALFSRNYSDERHDRFVNKIWSLSEYVKKVRGTDDQINDIAAYACKSIANYFADDLAKM